MPNLARDLTAGFNIGSKMIDGRRKREEDAWIAEQTPKIEAQMAEAENLKKTRAARLAAQRDGNNGMFRPAGGGETPTAPAAAGGDAVSPTAAAPTSVAPAGRATPVGAGAGVGVGAGGPATPNWLDRTLDFVGLGPAKSRMPAWAVKAAMFPGQANDVISTILGAAGAGGGTALDAPEIPLESGADAGDVAAWRPPVGAAGPMVASAGRGGVRGSPPADVVALARQAGQQYQVNPSVLLGVMDAESSFNPRAISRAGAGGLMQLMPGTARDMNPDGDRFNPEDNVGMGARYLSQLIAANGGNLERGLMGYHAGPGNLAKGKIGPATRAYVRSVLGKIPGYGGYDQQANG